MSDDFTILAASFRRDLRVRNRTDATVTAYLESVERFAAWARGRGVGSVALSWGPGGGPRNVRVRYLDDGSVAVIPFPRRLRRAPAGGDGPGSVGQAE